ncbi:hypothetical protein [Micromonospora avicenniae]|uniref:hypothetical protein n=1 Tax=Micromonospora avicenniae TaxID=1198245 RepID=UPI0034266D95
MQQVGPRVRGQRPVVVRGAAGWQWQVEPAAVAAGGVQQASPDLRPGQVDRHHLAAPPQHGGQGAYLGARAEHDDALVTQVQPVGVVDHRAHRVGARGFDDAAGDPRVETASQVVAAQALAPVRQREFPLDRTVAGDGGRVQRRMRAGCREDLVESALTAVVADHRHPGVQGGESGAGDGDRGVGGEQARLQKPAEVAEVPVPPVRLVLGRPGADRIDSA